ncbi:hypothetical protein EB796_007992 [Bugula neritina]|uniref:Choline/carnitine acyltransferase domain-containing protein n=1 Tax=Bugula neritina TaxID=10212 RepID=A0A7J7K4Y6_BUGNE|nr:hypothetical protein EB796_007992 [Bugula neritina]
MSKLADDFFGGIGKKLQRYLILKSWWSTNYVTDWWEEYVYLRGRSPIMVNSNYYGLDVIFVHPTHIQAARAGNMVYAFLKFREQIEHETLEPLLVNKTVPLDSVQYERLFNTTRIPGVETDILEHINGVTHIAVLSKGRYYKVYTHVTDDSFNPETLKGPLSRLSRKAAFVLVLDDVDYNFSAEDQDALSDFAKAMLHGNCYNRWFDKSFTLVISANGRVGFNAEHSWADAPIIAQAWEIT